MKVVRLKKGYQITVTDIEYRVLRVLLNSGAMEGEGEGSEAYPGIEDPAIRSIICDNQKRNPFVDLDVDEDRRDAAPTK